MVRRRARHVVTENERVLAFAEALQRGDTVLAGRLLGESHRSLAEDFEVTTPGLDDVVAGLAATRGVLGARMTGAGFGGVAIALCDAGARVAEAVGGWTFRPAQGVVVEVE